MAVRIGQTSATKKVEATDSVATDFDTDVMTCSTIGDDRYLVVGILISDNNGNTVTINSVVFDPTGTPQALTLIEDAVSAGKMFYYAIQNPSATDAVVRVNATSSGADWNAVMVAVLMYGVAQDPIDAEALFNTYTGTDDDDHVEVETSGEENQVHLTLLGIDSTPKGTAVEKPGSNDGSAVLAFISVSEVDSPHGVLLNILATVINGDKYNDRTINKTWTGERTTFYAFDVRVADYSKLHVDIPGAIGLPGHVSL